MLIIGGFFIHFFQREQKNISSMTRLTTGSLFFGKQKNVVLHGLINAKFKYFFFKFRV